MTLILGLKNWILPQKVLKKLNQYWSDGWKKPKKGNFHLVLFFFVGVGLLNTYLFCNLDCWIIEPFN